MRAVRVLKWAGIATLVICSILALVLTLALGTEQGRLWLVERAVRFAEQAGATLELQNLRTPSLGTWRGDHLRVLRQGQLLVEIDSFELIWVPSALFDRQLLVKRLAAEQVAYHHSQTPSETPASTETSDGQSAPPVHIVINEFHVGRLSLHNLIRETLPDYRASGSLSAFGPVHPLHVQLEIASIDGDDMRLTLDTHTLPERAVRISGNLQERAGGLLGTLARWPEDQAIEAQFVTTIEQDDNQLRVALDTLHIPISGHSVQAQGNIRYASDTQTLTIPELLILIDDKPQKVRGGYSPLDLWAELNLDQLPLDLLKPWVADLQSGSVSGTAELNWLHKEEGRWPNITANTNAQVTYRQQTLQAQIVGRLENKLLNLQPSSIQLEETKVLAHGQLDLEGSGSNLQGSVSRFDTRLLERWSLPIPPGLQARAKETQFSLRGSLQNPALTVDTQVDGQYQERRFALELKGKGSRHSAQLTRAHLVSGEAEIRATGVLDWSGNTTNLQVNMENLTEDLLKLAPEGTTDTIPEELDFDASGALQISGPLRQPLLKAQGLVVGTYQIPSETLPYRLTLDGDVQVGDLQALRLALHRIELTVFDTPTLVLEGNYTATSMDLHLRMASLPTRMLAALGWHKVDGEAEADIHLQGSLEQPLIQGFLAYRDQLPGRGGRIPVAIHADMTTEGEEFKMLTSIRHDDEPAGNLSMSLPLGLYLQSKNQQDVPLHVDAQGAWDLRFLRLFIDPVDHRFDGKLGADFTVRGTVQTPIFLGELKLTEGSYNNAVTGTQLEDITLTLQGSGQSVLVKDARARSGDDGYLSLAGEVHWEQQRRQARDAIALTLEARNAMILHRRDLQGEIQGQLKVEGSFNELWVTGEMEIAPLNASVESAMSSSIPEIKVTEVHDEQADASPSTMPIINLDIALIADRQAYLRGRGLDTELGGRIHIQGTAANPLYSGIFTTRRGHIDLFGKRFVLQNGEVRFNNDGVILRIPAVYSTADVEIRAELYGTADEPKLKLTSVPSRPEDEILALLIFGKPIDQITAFEAIRLAAAVRALSSGGGFDPVDSARQMLGVDALTIDNSTTEGGSGVSVGVGKYLSEKVYLELKRTPNPTQPWQGSVQVELTPKLTLQSGTSEDGGGGAELLWKRDY